MAEGKDRVLIVAGEASGDLHGASLIRELKRIDPSMTFYGIGGRRMEGEGLLPLYEASRLSTIGITEALGRASHIFRAYRRIVKTISQFPPQLAILIDYPEFNLFLAGTLKRSGVPVVYFISPQVWAWRRRRIRKIARVVDKMIVVFPFEVPLYREAGLDVEFLGHPLLDDEGIYIEREEARRKLGVEGRVLALLPGSRVKEVERHLPLMIEASKRLSGVYEKLSFLLPLAEGIDLSLIRSIIAGEGIEIRIVEDAFYETLKAADAGIIASGTATLQAALAGLPMVVVYKVSPITYWIGKLLIEVDTISLVNIVAGRKVVDEFIQNKATPEAVAESIERLFQREKREELLREFSRIRNLLGERGAMGKIARSIYNFFINFKMLERKYEVIHQTS